MSDDPISVLMSWARQRGWNRSELARQLGESPQTIYNWTRRGLPSDKYAPVATCFGRSIDELLGQRPRSVDQLEISEPSGAADRPRAVAPSLPLTRPNEPLAVELAQAQPESLRPGEMWLPRHDGVYPRMGRGGMDDGHEVVTLVKVSIDGFRRQLGAARISSLQALRLVTAFGDSMRPTFDDGDMLVVDTGVQAVGQDGIYLLRGPDDILVKRVQRKADGAWLLISSNKEYETERIEPEKRDAFAVLGRVVFAWRGEVV